MKKWKPILCLDFDGVIHSYTSPWVDAVTIPGDPVPGAMRFIWDASQYFTIAIYSSRSSQPGGIIAMQEYVERYLRKYVVNDRSRCDVILSEIQWPTSKPPAFLTIDDRALTFKGDWSQFKPEDLLQFKPWMKTTV